MTKNLIIRRLQMSEKIPYDLLLLADETIEAINKYIDHSEVYIVEEANKPIAVYVLCPINNQTVEIKNIAVATPYQGQGIGRFLIHDAEKRAIEKGCTEILIGTADCAILQLNLYKKMGYEPVSVIKDFFITNYQEPIFENGKQLKDMLMLSKKL